MAVKRLKHKELYKNILLLILIPLSIVLFFRLWFGGWVWSYNMEGAGLPFWGMFQKSPAGTSAAADEIVMPKRIIITAYGKRSILEKGSDAFSSCYGTMSAFSANGQSSSKPVLSTKEEFESGLKSKSVLLDFGSAYGKELLALMGNDLPVNAVQSILITPGDSVIQKMHVYFKDYTSGEIYKLVSSMSNTEVNTMIDSFVSTSNAGNVPFAFELGFDKAKEQQPSEISQNILLDSYLTIGLRDEAVPEVFAETPDVFSKIIDNPSFADSLIAPFGFSPSTTRRYVEKDDATTFVNKTGTMKFSKTGYVEYTAEEGGISVTDSNDSSALSTLSNIYSLVQGVMKSCGIGEPSLHVSSDLYGVSNQDFSAVINIDYMINGRPVTIVTGKEPVHPITITVKNGKIVSYKHYIYRFRPTGNNVNTSSMIKAVDLLYSEFTNSSAEVNVSDIYKSYVYTVGEDMEILWCAKLKGEDKINIIRE